MKNLNVLKLMVILLILPLLMFSSCSDDDVKNENEITSIKISESTAELEIGAELLLVISTTPKVSADKVTWESGDKAIVTVANGTVTAIGEGSTMITATVGNKKVTCTITVKKAKVIGAEYAEVTASWNKYIQIDDVVFANVKASPLDGDETVYTDLSESKIAEISKDKATDLIIHMNNSADTRTTGSSDVYIVSAWIDWNSDGDFADKNEQIFFEEWVAKAKKTFTIQVTPPSGAAATSRVRVVTYFKSASEMDFGDGNMDSGDCVDFTYKLK